jgi:hypothetical protein
MKMNGYSTHQPLLVAAMVHTDGPILEIGGGFYSTPLISAFANGQMRRALTLDTSEYFVGILKDLQSDYHRIEQIPGIPFDPIGKFSPEGGRKAAYYVGLQQDVLEQNPGPFSVVFVDQGPGFLRAPAVKFYADRAEFIVVHDTNHAERYRFGLMSNFAYRWDFTAHIPFTTVVSNVRDCSIFRYLNPCGHVASDPRT